MQLAQDDGTASEEAADPIAEGLEEVAENAPTTVSQAVDVIGEQLGDLWRGLLESLPIILIALLVLVLAILVALLIARGVGRAAAAARIDRSVATLLHRSVRLVLLIAAVLFALSVLGVSVSNVVTLLAVLGFAIGLAVQGILQNFVSGVILLIRKPFRTGDQIITGDYEGTVEAIDFRETRLVAYDGTVALIPNAAVFDNPLVNLTGRGARRTTLVIGIDYRDDHDAARAVLAEALAGVDGVAADPAPEVLLTALGESSVDFELRYWTAPDIRSVRHVQDRVLSAAKSAVEAAGMTIPWPIRTLVVDPDSAPALSAGLRPRGSSSRDGGPGDGAD